MHQLFQSLLDDLAALQRFPNLMRRIVDDVPVSQFMRQMTQVSLLLLPFFVFADLAPELTNVSGTSCAWMARLLATSRFDKVPATKFSCNFAKMRLPV